MFFRKKEYAEPKFEIINSKSSFKLKEAYNSLATNVIYLPIEDKCKKIAISSSFYGEGKTSAAINLAISLASNLIDKKILLLDADMRNPQIASFLSYVIKISKEQQHGLSDYLSGTDSNCATVKTHINNLDVIVSGSAVLNPAALLNSENMNELLAYLSEIYDYIIIDTPPVNVVSDAVLLIGRINGYLLATRTKVSNLPSLSSATENLTSVGAEIYGIILTDNKK